MTHKEAVEKKAKEMMVIMERDFIRNSPISETVIENFKQGKLSKRMNEELDAYYEALCSSGGKI